MSGKQLPIDPVELSQKATQHEIRIQPSQNEMALARSNSQVAHNLKAGVDEFKTEKTQEHQKAAMAEAQPHIAKLAVQHDIKVAGRIDDMNKAEQNHETAAALLEGVNEYKTEKTQEHQKEAIHASAPHIAKLATQHDIKVAGKLADMEKAEQNAEKAHELAAGVKEIKLGRVESQTKQHKTELNKELQKE